MTLSSRTEAQRKDLYSMHVISRSRIRDFGRIHPPAVEPLDRWYRIAKKAEWTNFAELKKDFPAADIYKAYTISDIGGNKFRLIAEVFFPRVLLIRCVLTHVEYDKDNWKY